ncbi:helix-turn-helix domain-containing protein [Microbulbifer celer]|uniref:Helix-turn-helix domain-containing protein n=2 Tax=Microbulbifer TaxID=48073 RepID=A0ABW3U644_9GAMM|nr:helix-turn-helix transcriptional regulator [Microbulbifer celer]UFN56674.1 helix-turn-helix domain-containing protein [Microbulbifer celer]
MTAEQAREEKQRLREELAQGTVTLGDAVRRMRKITGMSQKEYARKIVGISPRILAEIEKDTGNPTLETLNKIGRPFGYQVGFVTRKSAG